MVDLNRLPSLPEENYENGIFIPLEPIPPINEAEYLRTVRKTIEHYQAHPHQVPYEVGSLLKLFHTPATAVIVGTGTVGLEAITYATRILPSYSTLIIFQNDIQDTAKLEEVLKTSIKGGDTFQWVISPPTDIGRLDQIKEFLTHHKAALAHTQLFIHAADKSKRYIPDRLHHQNVIAQIIRRSSIPLIEEQIEQYSNAKNPYVRILFSSMCSINRDQYRIPNIGPYQIGKVVGDEFFKSMPVRKNSYSFIIYPGGMHTMGEALTRTEEFEKLKTIKKSLQDVAGKEYLNSVSQTHADSMDSSGFMLKKIWQALQHNEAIPGKIYSIYGCSVPDFLGVERNILKIIEPAPYLSEPLEN